METTSNDTCHHLFDLNIIITSIIIIIIIVLFTTTTLTTWYTHSYSPYFEHTFFRCFFSFSLYLHLSLSLCVCQTNA